MAKKSGLGSLRTPNRKPTGGADRTETFSVEKGNAELVTKKGNKPSEAVRNGKLNLAKGIVTSATDVVNQITQSVERVKIAKNQLEQIHVTSKVELKKEKEKTKQTQIQEMAETSRHNKQIDKEIKEIKANLHKFELKNSKDIVQIENNHEEKMKFLNHQEVIADRLVGMIESMKKEIRNRRQLGLEVPETIYQELNNAMQQLVELSGNLGVIFNQDRG